MFLSSIHRLVDTQVDWYGVGFDVQRVKNECDGIIIPAANWLQSQKNSKGGLSELMAGLARLVEAADLPTVITGLGAQSNDGSIPDLPDTTLKLLKAVSSRCNTLSVRGTFSAEVLERHGIHNVTVTGCPSLLWHLSYPARVNRTVVPLERITLNATVPGSSVPLQPDSRMEMGQFIMREALAHDWDFVLQTETPFIYGMFQNIEPDTARFLSYVFGTEDLNAIRRYLRDRLRYFGSVGDWISYSANRDLIIGTRLHGVIAGLLAGTPSILVTHDTRTVEMGIQAGIPTITAEALRARRHIDPEACLAEADFMSFNKRQKVYFSDFIEFFDRNDVPHRLERQKMHSPT